MKRRELALSALLLGLAQAAIAQAPVTPDADTDARASLRAAEEAFARTVRDRDREAFAAFLDPEAIFAGAEALEGREAILAAWSVFFAAGGPTLEWHPEDVVVRSDGRLGMTRGPYRLTAADPDGGERTETGRFTSLWERQPDGGWRIVFDTGCPTCVADCEP